MNYKTLCLNGATCCPVVISEQQLGGKDDGSNGDSNLKSWSQKFFWEAGGSFITRKDVFLQLGKVY